MAKRKGPPPLKLPKPKTQKRKPQFRDTRTPKRPPRV